MRNFSRTNTTYILVCIATKLTRRRISTVQKCVSKLESDWLCQGLLGWVRVN